MPTVLNSSVGRLPAPVRPGASPITPRVVLAGVLVAAAASAVTAVGYARGVAVGFAGSVVAFILAGAVSNIIPQLAILWYFGAIAPSAIAAARLSQPRRAPAFVP